MGGQKFETTDPQKFLFGSISDLNYLGTRFLAILFLTDKILKFGYRALRSCWVRVCELAEAQPAREQQSSRLRSSSQRFDQRA